MPQHENKKGAWVVVTPDGGTIIEANEMNALRKAVAEGGRVEFVEWGNRVGEKPAPQTAQPKSARLSADEKREAAATTESHEPPKF